MPQRFLVASDQSRMLG